MTKLCRLKLGGPVTMPHRVWYLCIVSYTCNKCSPISWNEML